MDINLGKLWVMVRDREPWHAAVPGVTKSWTQLSDRPRILEIKAKINKWDLIKIKSFCTTKETISKVKTAFRMGENNSK